MTAVLTRHDLRRADGRRLFIYGELRGQLPADDAAPAGRAQLHQRYEALTDTWVAVSPSRNVRPSDSTGPDGATRAACPLCPGGPEIPFGYDAAVFENRFPTFVEDPPQVADHPFVAPSQGRCEVVLYTSRHEGSLGTLSATELARVIAMWRDRSSELWSDARHRYVMAFENRGEAVGATLTHPHGQIYAFDRMPPVIAQRTAALERHRAATGECLTCSVVAGDLRGGERLLRDESGFVSAVPFAARWPYEIHVRARRHGAGRLVDLDDEELLALAGGLRDVVRRYDGLFDFELPFMMVAQEAPAGASDWHLSFEFLPPHRSAHRTKIRASVETAAGTFINDTVPEESAAALRAIAVAPVDEESVPRVRPAIEAPTRSG